MVGLIVACMLFSSAMASDENSKVQSIRDVYISLDLQNANLIDLFKAVEQKTGFSFVYNGKELNGMSKVSINTENKSVADVLEEVSQKANVTFRQVNNNINVTKAKADGKEKAVEVILQTSTVTGHITGQDTGESLPGVNILEKGTSHGTITDIDGNFKIDVAPNATLEISSVGYISQEIAVNGRTSIDVVLDPDLTQLGEVVVTALGIERDKKSLGYSISTLSSKEITATGNTVNPLMNMYGKAAGVGVTMGAAGPTGAVDIKIRGAAGLESSANTRPLFVVDGIPIHDEGSNMASRGYDPLNSFDYGSGINDINPEDIESVEILKGAKASVLYGGEGANGVVLITTKKGKKTRGLGVNVNLEHTWNKPHSYIDFQNEYGSGTNEYDMAYTTDPNGNQVRDIIKSRYNFGPKFDNSTPIMFLDSIVRPYQAYPDNFIGLFRTGSTDNATVAISGANDKGNMRVAYTHYDYEGILDNYYQKKDVLSFSGKMKASDFATFEINSNLYNINTHNRYPNIQDLVAWGINRDYPFTAIEDMYKNPDGSKFDSEGLGWPGQFSPVYLMNILWQQYENSHLDAKFHYIGSIRTTLNFTKNLYFVGQAGLDYTDIAYTTKDPITQYQPVTKGGSYAYSRDNNLVENYRAFLNYDQTFNDINVLAFIGGEYKKEGYNNLGVSTYGNLTYPDFWNLDNSTDWPDYGNRGRVRTNDYGSRVTYSMMGSATLSYKDELYLELQGRNDWSSTLDPKNNSYFYPGLALNWNFTERYKISWLDFGKLRMSWADVGRPAPGYYYAYQSYSTGVINNSDAYTVNGPSTLFSGDIKPERKREYEIGFDGRLLNDRVETNFSYYTNNVYDQIMGVDLSATTGATSIKINAGNVANWGYEFFVRGSVLSTDKFRWDLTYTMALQRSKVKKLYPGISTKNIGSVGSSVLVTATEGEAFGNIMMYDYLTDGQGNRVVDQNGYYVLDKSDYKKFGNISDNFFGGFMSDFYYKGLNFHVGLDYKFGGSLFSYTNYYTLGMGITNATLPYRDESHGGLAYYVDDATGKKVQWEHNQAAPPEARDGLVYHDGVIRPGVVQIGGTAENPQYAPNETILSAADYYSAYIHDMSQDFQPDNLYKNNYIKLREVAISYTIPESWTSRFKIQKLVVSVIGRDLFYLYKSIPNVDAESALGTGSYTEYSFFPSVQSYGFGLNVSF